MYDGEGNCVGSYSAEPETEPEINSAEPEADESYVAWDDDEMLVAGCDDCEDPAYWSDVSSEASMTLISNQDLKQIITPRETPGSDMKLLEHSLQRMNSMA